MSTNGFLEDRAPTAEMGKRAGEAGAGMVAATKAAALKNWMADQDAYRQRVANAEQAGWKALGMDMQPTQQGTVARGGDIVVTGDVYGDAAVQALAARAIAVQQATMQPTATPAKQKTTNPLVAAALGALLLAGGAGLGVGIPWALGAFSGQGQEAIDTDTATKLQAFQLYQPSETSP